jgi:hypothetical protein
MMFIQEVELFKGIPSHIIDEIAELVTQERYIPRPFGPSQKMNIGK